MSVTNPAVATNRLQKHLAECGFGKRWVRPVKAAQPRTDGPPAADTAVVGSTGDG